MVLLDFPERVPVAPARPNRAAAAEPMRRTRHLRATRPLVPALLRPEDRLGRPRARRGRPSDLQAVGVRQRFHLHPSEVVDVGRVGRSFPGDVCRRQVPALREVVRQVVAVVSQQVQGYVCGEGDRREGQRPEDRQFG